MDLFFEDCPTMEEENNLNDFGGIKPSTAVPVPNQATPSTSEQRSSEVEQPSTPVRKKTGRPPKSAYEGLKPTRESKRKRKAPEVMNYDDSTNSSVWSVKEKKELLSALETHGIENIEELRSCLPNKSKNQIENQIKMWKSFGGAELERKLIMEKKKSDCAMVNCITNLKEWMEHFQQLSELSASKQFALGHVFLLIAEYGKFPSPEECQGVDFRALYRYIHCMLNGLPFYGLNRETLEVLDQSVKDMFYTLREQQRLHNLQPHLYVKPELSKKYMRTYSRHPLHGVSASKNPEVLFNLLDVNPLNLRLSALIKPEHVKDNSCDEDGEN